MSSPVVSLSARGSLCCRGLGLSACANASVSTLSPASKQRLRAPGSANDHAEALVQRRLAKGRSRATVPEAEQAQDTRLRGACKAVLTHFRDVCLCVSILIYGFERCALGGIEGRKDLKVQPTPSSSLPHLPLNPPSAQAPSARGGARDAGVPSSPGHGKSSQRTSILIPTETLFEGKCSPHHLLATPLESSGTAGTGST